MKQKKQNKYIYIVLVKSLTGFSKIVRFITKYDYTHIAICLDEEFNDFITFSRKKHYSPFDSGFMHETLDCYAFGKYNDIKLKIFKIPVNKNTKENIEDFIKQTSNEKDYLFNFLSMITMPIFHGFRIYKTYNCMSFVSKIIKLSNCVTMDKEYYKYDIKQIDNLLNKYLYKEEYFKKEKIENEEYMSRVGLVKNIIMFFKLNSKLLYRIITKKGSDLDE